MKDSGDTSKPTTMERLINDDTGTGDKKTYRAIPASRSVRAISEEFGRIRHPLQEEERYQRKMLDMRAGHTPLEYSNSKYWGRSTYSSGER